MDEATKALARAHARANPPLIMTLEDIADLLGYSYNHMRNDVQHQVDFPAKLERFKHPRWARGDILAWAGVHSA